MRALQRRMDLNSLVLGKTNMAGCTRGLEGDRPEYRRNSCNSHGRQQCSPGGEAREDRSPAETHQQIREDKLEVSKMLERQPGLLTLLPHEGCVLLPLWRTRNAKAGLVRTW